MSVVCIASYHSVEEALVAKSKLQAYGMLASFPEEYVARLMWAHLQGASKCHIEVPLSQAEEARWLLSQYEEGTFSPVEYDVTKHKMLIVVALLLSLGYFGLFFLADMAFHWWKNRR